MRNFFIVVAKMLHIEGVNQFALKIPNTLYKARKYVGTEGDSFVKYATCSTCQKIYTIDEKLPNVSKKCDHIEFPHHPMTRYRKPCGTVLMKNVRYSNGTEHLCPRNVFCYQSLIESFQNFLKRPNFIENCQKVEAQTTSQ